MFDGAPTVKIMGEPVDVHAEIALLAGISGHADQAGLLNWLSGFENKPKFVFVNHGDDDSCMGLANTITEEQGIPAQAPYAGSCYDLLRGEWIRLTEPVRRKNIRNPQAIKEGKETSAKKRKVEAFRELKEAVEALNRYIAGLSGMSNSELKKLTKQIQALMK